MSADPSGQPGQPAQPGQPEPTTPRRPEATGLRAIGQEQFDLGQAVGGWRGLVESTAPGLVFVVVFIITREVVPTAVAALAVALVAVVARLVRRGSVTYALGGVVGVAIGVFWAWRTGDAGDFYVWGLITNAAFALAAAVSLIARYPLVGLVAGALGLTRSREVTSSADSDADDAPTPRPAPATLGEAFDLSWRSDPDVLRRMSWATLLWLGAFVLRLAVQVPLYLGDSVAWLGTARLVMGLPLWALVLWVTWLLVRPRAAAAAPRPAAS